MEIHKKFDSLEEYKEFVEELLSWKEYEKSLWDKKDYPKLKPFFDYMNKRNLNQNSDSEYEPMSKEVEESYDLWVKCKKDYADERIKIRDAVSDIDQYVLEKAFYYKSEEYKVEDEVFEEANYSGSLTFPLIVTGYLDSFWDRSGTSSCCVIRFVELKEFQNENDC